MNKNINTFSHLHEMAVRNLENNKQLVTLLGISENEKYLRQLYEIALKNLENNQNLVSLFEKMLNLNNANKQKGLKMSYIVRKD